MAATTGIRRLLKIATQRGERFVLHPYSWDEANMVPAYNLGARRLAGWYCNIAALLSYNFFVMFRLGQVSCTVDSSLFQVIYLQFASIYFIVPAMYQMVMVSVRGDIPASIRRYMQFFDSLDANDEMPRVAFSYEMRICRRLGVLLKRCNDFVAAAVTLRAFVSPESPELVSSILPEPAHICARLLGTAFHGYMTYGYSSNALFMIYSGFGFILPALHVLRELPNLGVNERMKTYRELQVLMQEFNAVFGTFAGLSKILIFGLSVYGFYGAVRFKGIISISMAFIGIISSTLLAALVAILSRYSGLCMKVQATFRGDVGMNKELKARVRALRVVELQTPGFKSSGIEPVAICDTVVQAAVNLLVMYN